jgi:hypothetical protein
MSLLDEETGSIVEAVAILRGASLSARSTTVSVLIASCLDEMTPELWPAYFGAVEEQSMQCLAIIRSEVLNMMRGEGEQRH